jgi:hypothetical protein
MKDKIQILLIHGGETFKSQKDYLRFLNTREISVKKKAKWSHEYLDRKLGKKFEIIKPRMPLQDNAKYDEWKIHFERHFPYLRDNIILIGGSLGGIFLAQYLSENKFPKKILSTYLIAPPFDSPANNKILGLDIAGGFKLKNNLSLFEENSPKIYLFFSEDDPSVPVSHAEKYRKKLKNVEIIIYKSKNGHFNIAKFSELVKLIKRDARNLHN